MQSTRTQGLIIPVYLHFQLLTTLAAMVVLMIDPKASFPQPLSTIRELLLHYRSLLQMRETPLLKHLQVLGPFTLPLRHSFPRGIDVTETPLSKCVPLCRPTWVQGVIPRKGALLSFRITV